MYIRCGCNWIYTYTLYHWLGQPGPEEVLGAQVFLSRAVWLVSNSGGALAYVNFCTYSGGDEKRRIGIVL